MYIWKRQVRGQGREGEERRNGSSKEVRPEKRYCMRILKEGRRNEREGKREGGEG